MANENKVVVNSDTYDIMESINAMAKRFIPDMTEDTLALGLPGFIIALETTKVKNAAIMTNTLGNEVFPSRAILDHNVITHAIMQGVSGVNAVPAYMTVVIGLMVDDFNRYATSYNNGTMEFYIDKYSPIIIGEQYPFHLDYDIIVRRVKNSSGYVYTATYNLPESDNERNRLSEINNPYMKQPYVTKIGDTNYIFLQSMIHQVHIKKTYKSFISSNVIDNRTIVFTFDDSEQLADFEIKITEPVGDREVVYLTPIFEGSAVPEGVGRYCEYVYVNTNTIRIKFVRGSYLPKLNSECEIVIKTTLGSEGVFKYNKPEFINYYSETYGYPSGIQLLIRPNTDSVRGIDRKTVQELREILPKEILMNGSITTETDLTNYFNLTNTDTQKMIMMRKSDNQIERIYYAYMVVKNQEGNIVPTNTIAVNLEQQELVNATIDGYILPAGTPIAYYEGSSTGYKVTNIESEGTDYKYLSLYTIYISTDPLYAAFFLTIINDRPYAIYRWINGQSRVQFIIDNFHFQRKMIEDPQSYKLEFTATQNINMAADMYILNREFEVGDHRRITNNMKAYLVLYLNGQPHRYIECTLDEEDVDFDYYKYTWRCEFKTNNEFSADNKIRIVGMYIAGTTRKIEPSYADFPENVEAYVYILAKSEALGYTTQSLIDKYETRYDLDDVIKSGTARPYLSGYTVTNKFEIHGGLNLFVDYSNLLNTTITVADSNVYVEASRFRLRGVPVIGYDYIHGVLGVDPYGNKVIDDESGDARLEEFLQIMNEKKVYMDNALDLLENSFDLDYKFYNTYGPSRNYSLETEDRVDNTNYIGHIDLSLEFNVSLKRAADVYTKDNIINFIKDYIEDLNNTNIDFDINNLLSDTYVEFKEVINYIDFVGFNGNRLSERILHFYWHRNEDISSTPEFVNVRNTVDSLGNVIPDITINVTA